MTTRSILTLLLLTCSLPFAAQQRITLLFAGDLMQHQAQIESARQPDGSYDYTPCFAAVRPLIAEADIAVGNLEVTLGGKPYRGYPAFSAPDEYLYALKEAGFDVLLTANNHCLDRGSKGLERTINLLDSLHIAHTGTFRNAGERRLHTPLFIRKNGFCIALLNYTYGTNGITVGPPCIVNYIDRETIRRDILCAQARRPDAIIACMHWGEEYQSLPHRSQRELADWLIAQGVTHVIGSHPHVIQPMELRTAGRQDHVVVYSLGNFISNMSAPRTDGGVVVCMQLEKHPLHRPVHPPFLLVGSDSTETFHPSYPFSIVTNCHYELVWTARPQLTGRKEFTLLPVSRPAGDSLPLQARKRLEIFAEEARRLLHTHNIGIGERQK